MEPLEALSLAGTIVIFVQFAVQLFNGAKQISESVSGASESADSLKDVCSTLLGFMSGLQLTEQGGPYKSLHPHEVQLRSLAKACQADCEKLLGILRDLNIKTRSGPGWWRSFQVAFLEAAKSGDIKALKERIDGYQGVMGMIFLDLTKYVSSMRALKAHPNDTVPARASSPSEPKWGSSDWRPRRHSCSSCGICVILTIS